MAEWVTAGKVRMTPRGTYSSSAIYAVLDLVRSTDGSKYYIAKKPVPAGTALTNTEYFEAIVDVSSAIANASDAVEYIAPTETSPATAAHAVGKFIIYDGNLYSVKSAISVGDTLTVGTNITLITGGFTNDLATNLIKAQGTQPTEATNKVWFDTSEDTEVTLPEFSDFEALEEEVTDLQNAINAFNAGQEDFQSYYNHQLALIVGYYNSQGVLEVSGQDDGWRTIEPLYTTRIPSVSTNPTKGIVWKNGVYLGSYNYSDFESLPEFDSIAFQWNKNAVPVGGIFVSPVGEMYTLLSDIENDVEEIEGDISEINGSIDDLTDDIDYVKEITIETDSEEKTETLTYTATPGYYTTDGRFFSGGSYDNYRYTEILSVASGDIITFDLLGTGTIGVITAYSGETAISDKGDTNRKLPYTVPDGIDGVRLTYYSTALNGVTKTYTQITRNVKGMPELIERVDALEDQIGVRHITNGMVYEFDIDSDDHELSVLATRVQDMFGYSIQFDGRVTTFNGLTLGHGYNVYMSGYVKITSTTFEYYLGTETSPRLSEAHNLTIKDYISVRIDAMPGFKANFTVYTNGGSYVKTNQVWDVRTGRLFVNSNGTNVLTGCKFAYMCRGWAEKVHLYGDSYFGVYSDKWTNYLTANNWLKCNLNAYPGRASAEALTIAKNVLQHSNPEMIIWCMGMNDGDDGGIIDTTWKACVEELETICAARGIELILSTIPNVPTVDNTAKNAYVRASGHRYIDFAAAVGASSDTTWFDGMLSSDNVHPSTLGAIALFNQAIADVPELMQ